MFEHPLASHSLQSMPVHLVHSAPHKHQLIISLNEQHACLAVGFIIRKQKTTKLFVPMHFTLGPWQRNNERWSQLQLWANAVAFDVRESKLGTSIIMALSCSRYWYYYSVCLASDVRESLVMRLIWKSQRPSRDTFWCSEILLKKFLFIWVVAILFFYEYHCSSKWKFQNEIWLVSRVHIQLLTWKKITMGMCKICTKNTQIIDNFGLCYIWLHIEQKSTF